MAVSPVPLACLAHSLEMTTVMVSVSGFSRSWLTQYFLHFILAQEIANYCCLLNYQSIPGSKILRPGWFYSSLYHQFPKQSSLEDTVLKGGQRSGQAYAPRGFLGTEKAHVPLLGNTQSILSLICIVAPLPHPAHLSVLQIPEPGNTALYSKKDSADAVTSQLLEEEIILESFKCHYCGL